MGFIATLIGIVIGCVVVYTIMYNQYNKDLCKTCKHCSILRRYRRYGDSKCFYTYEDGEIRNNGEPVYICSCYERK